MGPALLLALWIYVELNLIIYWFIQVSHILSRAISIGRKKKKNTKTTVLKTVSFAVINYQSYGFDEKCLVEKSSCKKTEYQQLPFDIQEKEIVITVS